MLSLLSASFPCDLRASSPPFPLSFQGRTNEVSYFANEDTLMVRQQTLLPKVKPLISDRASVWTLSSVASQGLASLWSPNTTVPEPERPTVLSDKRQELVAERYTLGEGFSLCRGGKWPRRLTQKWGTLLCLEEGPASNCRILLFPQKQHIWYSTVSILCSLFLRTEFRLWNSLLAPGNSEGALWSFLLS